MICLIPNVFVPRIMAGPSLGIDAMQYAMVKSHCSLNQVLLLFPQHTISTGGNSTNKEIVVSLQRIRQYQAEYIGALRVNDGGMLSKLLLSKALVL